MRKYTSVDLVNFLRYEKAIPITKISKEIRIHEDTITRWGIKNWDIKKKNYQKLLDLIGDDISDVKKSRKIVKILRKIKDREWKQILLGIIMKMDLRERTLDRKFNMAHEATISTWLNGYKLPLTEKKYKIIKFVLENNLDIEELIKLSNSVKIGDNFIPLSKSIKRGDYSKAIIYSKGEYYLDSKFMFPLKRNNRNIHMFQDGKYVVVCHKDRLSNSKTIPLRLKEFIKLDEVFLTGLGIYSAEGAKNRHPKITNSESLVIQQAIKFFNCLGIPNSRFAAWIQLHERSEKSLLEAKKYWLENVDLKEKNIRKLRVKKSSGNAPVKQYGTLHLEVNSILFQILIKNLLGEIPYIIENIPREKSVYFLRGEYAGEGSVSLRKNGTLQQVRYTSKSKRSRKIIGSILSKFDIEFRDDPKRFETRISKFGNLKKLHQLDIFRYHPLRRKKLKSGLERLIHLYPKRFV